MPDPTREQIAPLPDDARMEAYYYGFERTGVGFIDAILSAVAIAGKGAHHTESWAAPWDGTTDYFCGHPGLPDAEDAVDLIQKAAQQAADAVLALLPQPDQSAETDPYEYAVTTGPRKAWLFADEPPEGEGWELDPTRGREGESWDRFDYHEERYWRRLKPKATT